MYFGNEAFWLFLSFLMSGLIFNTMFPGFRMVLHDEDDTNINHYIKLRLSNSFRYPALLTLLSSIIYLALFLAITFGTVNPTHGFIWCIITGIAVLITCIICICNVNAHIATDHESLFIHFPNGSKPWRFGSCILFSIINIVFIVVNCLNFWSLM